MLTYARTTVFNFTTEGTQRILGGDASRVWIQFLNPSLGPIGVGFVPFDNYYLSAFQLQALSFLQLTKGNLGSVICNEWYGGTGVPATQDLYVTEVLLY